MSTEGSTHFFPRMRDMAVMPAAAAVTCPEGKEKPSSAGAPTNCHHWRNCSTVSKGLGLAMVSFRMMLVIKAPQHTAPKMQTPKSLVRAKQAKTTARIKNTSPFSPRRVISFISGVSTVPALWARE